MKWIKRIGIGLVVLSILVVVGANAYWKIGRNNVLAEFPPPGQMFSIGTHSLHLYCVGEGSPTVILESGALGFSRDWGSVLEQAKEITRICAYDRAGMGWSDLGPEQPAFADKKIELSALLDAAGEQPPYLLVGHSSGFALAWSFYEANRDDVIGLISVDGFGPNPDENPGMPVPSFILALERFGVLRIPAFKDLSDLESHGFPQWAIDANVKTAFLSRRTVADFHMHVEAQRFMAEVTPLGDLPLIAIASDKKAAVQVFPMEGNDELWEMHREANELAASYSNVGELRPAEGATHFVQRDRPDVVVKAIADMVDDYRENQ